MNDSHRLALQDTEVFLRADKTLWWPQAQSLFVADVHLGKAAAFRASGLAVPEGTTQDNLQRLSQAIAGTRAQRVVVLGDFLHARQAQHPLVWQALADWRQRHRQLDVALVRGNHDRHAGDPPAALGFTLHEEPWPLGSLSACHHPDVRPETRPETCPAPQPGATSGTAPGATVLAGHVHPVVQLGGAGRDGLRLPCFVHQPGCLVLPAFGAFTGGQPVAQAVGVDCYAVGAGRVWRLPPAGRTP